MTQEKSRKMTQEKTLETFLSPRQIATLSALTERMLPSDDGPGAAEANVMGHIRWLAGRPHFQSRRPQLISGLDLVQSLARDLFDKDFKACSPGEKERVLEELRKVPHPVVWRFLAAVLSWTLAGFLCDPEYGGNRGEVGWRFVGFERRTGTAQPDAGEEG